MTRLFKPLSAGLLAAPLLWLGWLVWLEFGQPGSGLGADPAEALVHYLGEWSLRILLVAFSITPLRRLTGFKPLVRIRRMVGLFAFSYVALHLIAYMGLFVNFDWAILLEDVVDRAYITVGFAAFLCLLPMAITSTRGWQRRLGQRWQKLHQLVYVAVGASLVHLFWLTRDGYFEVFAYTLWFVVLLLFRGWYKGIILGGQPRLN